MRSSQMHCFSSAGEGSPNWALLHATLLVLFCLIVVNCSIASSVVISLLESSNRRP